MALLMYLNQNPMALKDLSWSGGLAIYPPLFCTVSRTEYKPDAFHYKSLGYSVSEIKNSINHKLTWEELMDKEARRTIEIDSDLYVAYSGGIDSTGIVVSLLKNCTKEELKKVTILCTPSSVYEFPEFFNVIVKNFKVELATYDLERYAKKGHIISGAGGDGLFGSATFMERAMTKFDKDFAWKNYKDTGSILFETYFPGNGKMVFDRYQPIAEECAYPIENIIDFACWYEFTQHFNNAIFMHLYLANSFTDMELYKNKIVYFFRNKDFEIWSVNNRDCLVQNTVDTYKWKAKEYIINYTGLDNYHNKGKFGSYYQVLAGNRFNGAIDENWNLISHNEALQYLR
jgi:hypothetical protein